MDDANFISRVTAVCFFHNNDIDYDFVALQRGFLPVPNPSFV